MATKTKKKVDLFSTIMTIVIILIIVGGLLLLAVQTLGKSGILLRAKTVAKSDNFEVSGTMMQYAVMTEYNTYVNTVQQQYGITAEQMGFGNGKKLSEIKQGEGTWLDYFTSSAKTTVEQMLVYAEAAKAAGYTLSDEDKTNIDSNISTFKLLASYYGMSADAYISSTYGQGVKEKDIRAFLEISTVAERYSTDMAQELEDGIKTEDVDKFYEENKKDYTIFDVISYSEKINITTEGKSEEQIKSEKDALKTALEKLTTAKTSEEFKAILCEIKGIENPADKKDGETAGEEKAPETGETEAEDGNDSEEEKEDDEKTALDDVKEATVAIGDVSGDIKEWIFEEKDGALVRVNGESKIFEENTENKGTGEEAEVVKSHDYTVTVYVVLSDGKRDEAMTKDVAHILFKTDTYGTADKALTEAEKILEEYNKGDKTKESFEKLGEEYTEDSNVTYENVRRGDMVEEFENWIYDENRKAGDVGIVETEYGQHIMYFVGDGDAHWYADCFDAYFEKLAESKYDEFKAKYAVSYSEKAAKAINC